MDLSEYDIIKRICAKNLVKRLHDRHLEDLVQYVCLRSLERPRGVNFVWCVYDYCRANGIGKRGKLSAKSLEYALSLDSPSKENSGSDSYYLIDNQQKEHHNGEETISGILEEFLIPLNIKKDALKWAIKTYQKYLNKNRLNSLMRNSV